MTLHGQPCESNAKAESARSVPAEISELRDGILSTMKEQFRKSN